MAGSTDTLAPLPTLPALARSVVAAETSSDRRDRLNRRLESWLAHEPRPVDIVTAVYAVAERLDADLPGGLRTVTADVYLDILCQSLLYCDLVDFMAVWPSVHSQVADSR
jgi:hypothetical protein